MSKHFFVTVVALLSSVSTLFAQWPGEVDSTSFLFDADGSFTRVSVDFEDVKAKLVTVNPLIDNIMWKKTVIRAIDLRERQNWPLYYPYENIDSLSQKNLFSVIFKVLLQGDVKGYLQPADKLTPPPFTEKYLFDIQKDLVERLFGDSEDYADDYKKIEFITQGIIKYYIQETWYFDKHTSTLGSKILSIAPVYNKEYNQNWDPAGEVDEGVMCWIPFERLRPYMQMEFMKTTGRNVNPIVDFDNFFVSRQFDSYIIKDYDVRGTLLDDPNKYSDPSIIREEQERIENEILNLEQDLWHY